MLLLASRAPGSEDYSTTTASYTLENALKFARKTIPNFERLIRDKVALDSAVGTAGRPWPCRSWELDGS